MSAKLLKDRFFFEAVKWNAFNKVVLDHRNGYVFEDATNDERRKRGLPVPWKPEMMPLEIGQPPVP